MANTKNVMVIGDNTKDVIEEDDDDDGDDGGMGCTTSNDG